MPDWRATCWQVTEEAELTLPAAVEVKRNPAGDMQKGRHQTETAAGVFAKMEGRILVVDDDPHFLRVLARILKTEDLQVCCAADAAEALRVFKELPIDVVISDLRMPECDGLHFVQQLRAMDREVPVIILTASDEVDTYLEAMNAGANEYLHKPVGAKELLQTVRTCLQYRRSHRPEPQVTNEHPG
jgi:DNA-binding NtrC family response regulator